MSKEDTAPAPPPHLHRIPETEILDHLVDVLAPVQRRIIAAGEEVDRFDLGFRDGVRAIAEKLGINIGVDPI